jgi:hypothetical protein
MKTGAVVGLRLRQEREGVKALGRQKGPDPKPSIQRGKYERNLSEWTLAMRFGRAVGPGKRQTRDKRKVDPPGAAG